MTRRIPVAAALLAIALIPASAAAKPPAAPAQRFLASQQPFVAAINAKRATIRAHDAELTKKVEACARGAFAGFRFPSDDAELQIGFSLWSYLVADREQEALKPLGAAADAQAARFARLSTGDRVLDRAARALAFTLRSPAPEIDTCALIAQWKAGGFDVHHPPAALTALIAAAEAPGADRITHAMDDGEKRLRRDGLSARAAQVAMRGPDVMGYADDQSVSGSASVVFHFDVELDAG